jgi:DNA helicase-2/ATP-dependent DNA helicase PcrA
LGLDRNAIERSVYDAVIDEAQDLNEAQYRLLVSLCGSEFKNVMIVGDPKQAIYVWNGADPKYLDLFQRDQEDPFKKEMFHALSRWD